MVCQYARAVFSRCAPHIDLTALDPVHHITPTASTISVLEVSGLYPACAVVLGLPSENQHCSPSPWHLFLSENGAKSPSLQLHRERGELGWLTIAANVLLQLSGELPRRKAEGMTWGFVGRL